MSQLRLDILDGILMSLCRIFRMPLPRAIRLHADVRVHLTLGTPRSLQILRAKLSLISLCLDRLTPIEF
jgi:hypothetical protein